MRWIDSLNLGWANGVAEDERLPLALKYLADALVMESGAVRTDRIRAASRLVVVERRRLEQTHGREGRLADPDLPDLLLAVINVAAAMRANSLGHELFCLRYAEAHLRATWKANR